MGGGETVSVCYSHIAIGRNLAGVTSFCCFVFKNVVIERIRARLIVHLFYLRVVYKVRSEWGFLM